MRTSPELIRHETQHTAMNFFFLKKHNPTLLQISEPFCPSSSISLYLFNAPSISFFDCINVQWVFFKVLISLQNKKMDSNFRTCKIDPNASSAFEQFSSVFVTSNSLSNAPFVSLIRKYKIPISVRTSMLSHVILPTK